MKVKSVLAAICLMCAASAYAELPAFTSDPAAGSVESLSTVKVTFTDAETVALASLSYGNAPRVVKEGLDPTSSANCNFSFKPSVTDNTLTVPLQKEITDEGVYNFYLPKGLMIIDGTTLEEEIVITYTVGETPEPEPTDEWTVTPAEGEVALLSEITITFNNATEVTLGSISYSNAPRLVKEGADPTSSSNCNFVFKPTVDGNTLYLPLQKSEDKPGTYNFYLNKSVVNLDGEPMAEDIILTYVIPTAEYKLTCENETVLDEINSLTFAIDTDATLTINATDENLTIINTYSNESYEGVASVVDNKLVVSFDPAITASASYSLTIPEGFFAVDGVANNREWTFEFRISGTGDYTVQIEPAEGTVAELSSFVITFEGSPLGLGSIDSAYNPKLLNSSNSVVTTQIEASIQDQTLTLTLINEISKRGEYTLLIPRMLITLNDENPANDLKFTYTVDPTIAGVDTLTPDDTATEYFDMNGIRISEPANGIFIKKSGASIKKVVIE